MGEPGPLDASADPRLEQVLADYSRRMLAGQPVSQDDLIAQHPHLAEALRSHFAMLDPIEQSTAHAAFGDDPGTQYVRPSSQATIPPRASSSPHTTTLPERFGRYRVVRCLGQGAMGSVYLADDTQLERPVALKIPKFNDDADDEMTQRFYREARSAALLRHPNVCPVYDAGEIDGIRYLSMAYLEGRPLSEVLSHDGRPSDAAAVALVLKLARALQAAHARGVIHRDLKPANIMIDAHDEPILMDFGLARQLNKDDCRLTQEGLLMGSPAYMSPEQVEGVADKMGPGCDIYSLGIILYELLTGDVPFRGSIAAVMGQILGAAPQKPSARRSGLDTVLEAICLKMIAKQPDERFASMAEVVDALSAYAEGRPTKVVHRDVNDSPTVAVRSPEPAVARGIVIAPWMLLTAVAVIVAGFGVTWQLIAMTMKQQTGADEVKVSPQARQAIDRGEAKLLINDKEVSKDQLKQPIPLDPGLNKVEIAGADAKPTTIDVPKGDDQQNYLVSADGGYTRKRHHRLIAEWVLSQGGKVKLVGGTASLDKPDQLPDGKLELEEIDLQGVKSIPISEWKKLKSVASLKRIVLPKGGASAKQVDELHAALPEMKIEQPGS